MISAAATPSAGSACQAKPQSEAVEGVAPFFCYPGIARFSTDFGYRDYLQAVAGLRTRGSRNALALSLYLPAPSSAQPCILDGESVEGEVQDGSDNLAYLLRECEMQGRLFTGINQIAQMTLAGAGVATLAPAQLIALMQHLRCWFQFAPGSTGVYAIDVDVRRVTDTVLNVIRGVGFNQIRLRYPPIDPADTGPLEGGRVQHQTLAGMRRVKSAGYRSIQIDLQGGLARLDRASLVRSLDAMINAQIDRIVVAEDSPADTDVALLRRIRQPIPMSRCCGRAASGSSSAPAIRIWVRVTSYTPTIPLPSRSSRAGCM